MQTHSDNGLPLLNSDNEPNIEGNPMILAGFLDVVGGCLTQTLNDIGRARGHLTVENAQDLVACHGLLLQIRQALGVTEGWGSENQAHVTTAAAQLKLHNEMANGNTDAVRATLERFRRNATRAGFPPEVIQSFENEIAPKESTSDAAERILRELGMS